MYGAVEFYHACKEAGVKPIIGCEVYVAPRSRFDREHKLDSKSSHLVLLVKNETGYRNLCHMVSLSFTEGFYSKDVYKRQVVNTYPGMAAAAAAAIDGIGNENMIGSLAGDDTIFIVMRSEKLAMEFTENFRTTLGM